MQIGREPRPLQDDRRGDAAPEASASDAGASFDAFELAAHWRSLALAFVQSSRDCVKLIDAEGRVAALNPGAMKTLQLNAQSELLGASWAEVWPKPGRALVQNSVVQGFAGVASSFVGFCPTMRGEPRWWDVTVSPVADESGAVRCLLAVSRDVTALREREEEMKEALKRQRDALLNLSADFEVSAKKLRDAEARASHDDKMRVFGRFVGGVVHDFNNVFAAVHGAARLLRRRVVDPSALDIVGHLEKAAERGAGLARQLLDFSRTESEPIEVFDPSALLSRDGHLLRHIVSGGATLAVRAPADIWPVLGSPQKFQSVLFNLVANARDAVKTNGRIEVGLDNVGALARPEGLDVADYVRLTVVDDGCGLSPEALRRAGEPFFTTKPTGKGTGLGLASAFELAASCQGRAFVESEPGAGARVSIYLRRSPVAGETVATSDVAVNPALHGGAKILLVEDEPAVRDHLAAVFRDLNYVVVEASAVEIAAATVESETPFDLVVTDLNLRDGLGDQLVARLRARQPALPAIYVTGSSGFAIPREETVLRKPVSENQLALTVLEKLGRLPGAAASADALRQVERILRRIRDPEMKRIMTGWADRAQATRRIPSVFEPGPWRETPPALGFVAAVGAGLDPELRFVRVGDELEMRLGRPLVNTTLDVGDEQILGAVSRTLRRRLDGAPGYDYARFALGDGKISTMERLVLPLGDREGRVSHLFGLVAFGEADGVRAP